MIELAVVKTNRGYVEKYYQARARAYSIQELILPSGFAGDPAGRPLLALGSHDLALDLLAQHARRQPASITFETLPVGSLDGLVALRQGLADMAGCHLLDEPTGEYNLPYLRHLFPDRLVRVFTLVQREQGLLLPFGNPLGVRGLPDLARPEMRLINRNRGSGTRLWLDRSLQRLGLGPHQVAGYDQETNTHTGSALAIVRGQANVGLGLRATARQFGLDFIPLFSERYDLVLRGDLLSDPRAQVLMDVLNGAGFRRQVQALEGYETAHTGEALAL